MGDLVPVNSVDYLLLMLYVYRFLLCDCLVQVVVIVTGD